MHAPFIRKKEVYGIPPSDLINPPNTSPFEIEMMYMGANCAATMRFIIRRQRAYIYTSDPIL